MADWLCFTSKRKEHSDSTIEKFVSGSDSFYGSRSKNRVIGYTSEKVWLPLRNKFAFFGGLGGMLLSTPFVADQLKIFSLLHQPGAFQTGWSSIFLAPILAIVGLVGLCLFLYSIIQEDYLPIVATDENEKFIDDAIKAEANKMQEELRVAKVSLRDELTGVKNQLRTEIEQAKNAVSSTMSRSEVDALVASKLAVQKEELEKGGELVSLKMLQHINDIVQQANGEKKVQSETVNESKDAESSALMESSTEGSEIKESPTKQKRGRPKRASPA